MSRNREILEFFAFQHLSGGKIRSTSFACHEFAMTMEESLMDCDQKSEGLQKLLEAKDCFVRAAVQETKMRGGID